MELKIESKETFVNEAGDLVERVCATVDGHEVQIVDMNYSGTYTVKVDDSMAMVKSENVMQWIYDKLTGY